MQAFRRFKLSALIFVFITAAFGSTGINAQQSYEDYGSAAMIVRDVFSADCTDAIVVNVVIVNTYEQVLAFETEASIGGTIYGSYTFADEDPVPEGTVTNGVFGIPFVNADATPNPNLPVPSGQPVNLTIRILANNITPIWETRFTVTDCDGGEMSQGPVSGEIDNLIQNVGFEQAGETDKIAAKWEAEVDNDKRLCNDALIVAAHSGNCAYQFKANPTTKAKLDQVSLLEPTGLQGDRFDLSAWVKADALSAGSEIKLVVKYPTQPKAKIVLPIPEGSYNYTLISVPSVNLPETPTKVKVSVSASGEGSFVLDDLLAQRVINGAPQLSSTLLPLPSLP